jgi:hypothetical protein
MKKGRERARKGEEMDGWDEDELVGNLWMINVTVNGREKKNDNVGDEFGIT